MGVIGIQSDKSNIPRWEFRQMQPGEMNVDPIEGEFFTTEAIGSITDALVRESIQNSLDASAGNGPVKVRFSFFTASEKDAEEMKNRYIDGLGPHLKVKHSGLQEVPSPHADLDYIGIEDFGTRGLQGDIYQYDDLDDDEKRNDFYYFWRNIGRTRKESTDLGRWGLGKTVFQAASRINCFFGLTVREDDSRKLLMGQCVLKIHKVNGKRHSPYGYFGRFDDNLALPIEDLGYIEKFSEHFMVDRSDKPGLSILIPYPEEEIKAVHCVKSVIKHYFYPILSGKLIVEVRFSQKRYMLNRASLDDLFKRPRFRESLGFQGLLDLARWAIQQPEESHIRLAEPESGKAPKLRESLFSEEQLAMARQNLNENKRLAFYVPISIKRQNSKDFMHTGFSLFLEKNNAADRPEDYFIRQGITIPEVTSLKQKGIRALISITEPDLSTFLGDAENPAHTEWERNSKKFKRKYRLGPSTLDFVKSSPREIVKILTQPKKGRDENLLRHLFSLPADLLKQGSLGEKDIEGKGEKEGVPEPFIDVSGSSYLQLHRIKSGFGLTRKSKAKKVPKFITIWTAYEVRSGNPFKRYTPLDFELDKPPMKVVTQGAEILVKKNNVIQLQVKRPDFKLAVTGFDMNRDLRIKTNP